MTKQVVVLCRRLTVPLTGTGEATLSKLMQDDSTYTFSELPRVNPLHKVWRHVEQQLVS